jgi:hypothetical protein
MGCDPSGVGLYSWHPNRWYRCAQPPANGFDPSGVSGDGGLFRYEGSSVLQCCDDAMTEQSSPTLLQVYSVCTRKRKLLEEQKIPEIQGLISLAIDKAWSSFWKRAFKLLVISLEKANIAAFFIKPGVLRLAVSFLVSCNTVFTNLLSAGNDMTE